MKTEPDFPDFPSFVAKRIIVHIVKSNPEELRKACKLYGVNLTQFKKEHSEEIVFALLKK